MTTRYRDRLGHFLPRDMWEDIHYAVYGDLPRRRTSAPLSRAEWEALQPVLRGFDPAGTEYELTATTRGGSPRGRGQMPDPRVLHLKIRVTSEHAMSAETAEALLNQAVRTRRPVAGLTIQVMDWAKGNLEGDAMEESSEVENLRAFYGAITSAPSTRFARVRP